MQRPIQTLATVSSIALLLALGACGDRVETARTEKSTTTETTTAQTPPAAAPSSDTTTASSSSTSSDTTASSSSSDTSSMGATGSTGPIDDAQIVTKVNAALAADKDLSALKINVDSKSGMVTLKGKAPNAAAKDRASDLAKNVKDVKSVDNQLTLG